MTAAKIVPHPSSQCVFVGGPLDGKKMPDPGTTTWVVPKPVNYDHASFEEYWALELKDQYLPKQGTYERRHNEDTGVPGYVWMGWKA